MLYSAAISSEPMLELFKSTDLVTIKSVLPNIEELGTFCVTGLEASGFWGATDASLPIYKQGSRRVQVALYTWARPTVNLTWLTALQKIALI